MSASSGFVWSPGPEEIDRANVTRLMRAHAVADLRELTERSVRDPAWFWDAVVRDLDIGFTTPYDRVMDTSRGPAWTTWFVGGSTNVADQCVDRWAQRDPEAVAVVWEGEDGDVRRATFAELRRLTDAIARQLLGLGVAPGDRVGLFMPLTVETVAALMACSKIGAIWVPIFSGFGPDAVASRLADAGCEVLVTADATRRKGATVPMKQVADRAAAIAGGIRHLVVWARERDVPAATARGRDVPLAVPGQGDEPFDALPLDSEHPLFIGYTSGTTGRPKGAVHVHGGFLVKVAAEVAYQVDLHRHERLLWATDLGWIMGPWEIVGSLALGATVVLTEGSPLHPRPDRLLRQAARHGVHVLGVSPTLVRAMRAASPDLDGLDRSALRVLASTGEPWDPSTYTWLHEAVGEGRRPIVNISGGTEVGACFLSPHPVVPTKVASLGGPALGMDVDIVDPDGEPVGPGEVGELICRQPWPSMTRGIWGDDERYLDAYWRRFPGVWTHGDWASRDDDGYWFLHGRSDDTLSIAGKRIGPAEIESVVARHPAVAESAAVGVPDPIKGESIVCVVVLRPDAAPDPGLGESVRRTVRDHLGSAFTPSRVVVVDALPKTRSAKIVRRAVRAAVVGSDPGDVSSLEDASVLDAIAGAAAAS